MSSKIRQVKNQIINIKLGRKLKQLGFWSFSLVFPNGWSVLYLVSSKSWMHYSIVLKFSAVQPKWMLIKAVSAFFLIISRFLGIKHSYRMWLNDNSWHNKFAHFSKTAEKSEKMRHNSGDLFNLNVLNLKLYQKINSGSSLKAEFLSAI